MRPREGGGLGAGRSFRARRTAQLIAEQLEIPIRHVKHIELSGQDTASGKSWQTWMKKQEAAQAAAAEAAATL